MENKLIPYQATQCISANSVVVLPPILMMRFSVVAALSYAILRSAYRCML